MTRADLVVILLAVALLPLLYAKLWFSGGNGQQAGLWSGDRLVQIVALDRDNRLKVKGPLGDSVVEVRDHAIRFTDSPCRGKVCVHGGWLRESGDILACLPNRITLRVLGNEPRFDAINF